MKTWTLLWKTPDTYKSLVSAIVPSLWYGPAGSLNLSNKFDSVSFDTDVNGTLTIPSPYTLQDII